MSSRADDFDVRYRDQRDGAVGGSGAVGGDWNSGGGDNGVVGGTVDYDLGYDANGWDTQGFRSPAASYLDSRDTAHVGPTPPATETTVAAATCRRPAYRPSKR